MADWCYTFDFTKDRYDFTGYIAASSRGDRAVYSPGVGWKAANNFHGLVQIQSPTCPTATFTSFTMTISSSMT